MATNEDIIKMLEPLLERIATATEAVVVELKRTNSANPRIAATDGVEKRNDEPRPMGVHQ